MRCLIISDELWSFLDQFRFVRLLGKQPINAIDDPELNELFLAWEVIEPKWGDSVLEAHAGSNAL